MTSAARRARIRATIKLLYEQFPQAFCRRAPVPLKVGIYADTLAAVNGAVEPGNLKSALRAYTSNARYLRALSAGAHRVGLDGSPAGTVTAEDEAAAKARLADLAKASGPDGVEAEASPSAKQPKTAVEAGAKARLADLAKVSDAVKPNIPVCAEPQPKTGAEAVAKKENMTAPHGPKRLSLADLREAGRRRRQHVT